MRKTSRQHGCASRTAGGERIKTGQFNAITCQLINIGGGRFASVKAYIAPAQIVCKQNQNVLFALAIAGGRKSARLLSMEVGRSRQNHPHQCCHAK